MLNNVKMTTLKATVNEDALQAFQKLSTNYPRYMFFVSAINESAENLPEIATISEGDAFAYVLRAMQRDYAYLLPAFMKQSPAPAYKGMKFVAKEHFDTKLLTIEKAGFYVKDGKFFVYEVKE